MDTELRQQPGADEGADDAEQEIADQPEAGASNDLTGQPARHDPTIMITRRLSPDMFMACPVACASRALLRW